MTNHEQHATTPTVITRRTLTNQLHYLPIGLNPAADKIRHLNKIMPGAAIASAAPPTKPTKKRPPETTPTTNHHCPRPAH